MIAGGVAGSAASVASAQPYLINGSGATLLQALFRAPASTNDFIDVDANGITTATDPFNSQLAPFDAFPPFSNYWQVSYRVVGSVNGFIELRDWGFTYADLPDGDAGLGTLVTAFSDESLWNRTAFVSAGVPNATADLNNPAGMPVLSTRDGAFVVTTDPAGPTAGMQIDFAAIDVPVGWSLRQSGSALFNAVPGAPGYGQNARISVNKDGTIAGETNDLPDLTGINGPINVNTAAPDQFTVFDTPITLAPVAAMVNYGVGLQEIKMSDLRHLSATGRRINGENLVKVNRDVGSGTRNAFMNGIGLDPSFGVGENIGPRTVSSSNDLLGPNFQPSNKGGSSRVEGTVRNHRLAIGHTGAERGESSGWLINGQADVLAVQSDIKGGTIYARPTLDNVLDGGVDGYNIIGPAVIAQIGDARSAPASAGGWGWAASEVGPYPRPVQPPANENAAAYLNNITRAIASFVTDPGGDPSFFSPGEFLATQFLLSASATNVNNTNPAPGAAFVDIIPNPDLNQNLQDYIRDESGNVLGLPEFQTFNTTTAGRVPTRTTLANTYSDQALVPGGNAYIDQGGTTRAYGSSLALRNKIAGDFNGDGVRSAADAADMMAAYESRNGGAAWVAPDGVYGAGAGNDAIIEVLGDFNGDGNFDAQDVRYWADGLVLTADVLDRAAGFAAVDTNTAGGNFFGTSLATGAYDAGDSRADVSGPASLQTRGFQPIGQDGVVDAFDIDYVCMNFGDWSNLTDAAEIDLAADMNGDLVIDLEDVRVIVEDILDSQTGDVNLDGVVDATDVAIVTANQGTNGGYADGDLNCDGVIDADDLAIVNPCTTDFTGDGQTDGADLGILLGAWGTPDADLTGDGNTDGADLGLLLGAWGGC
jgi:hypothetical protein